jgi:hypothetical protein
MVEKREGAELGQAREEDLVGEGRQPIGAEVVKREDLKLRHARRQTWAQSQNR